MRARSLREEGTGAQHASAHHGAGGTRARSLREDCNLRKQKCSPRRWWEDCNTSIWKHVHARASRITYEHSMLHGS